MKEESKNQKFQRLTSARVNKISELLRKLSNLASPNYEYTDKEVEKVFKFLEERLKQTRKHFEDRDGAPPEFDWGNSK